MPTIPELDHARQARPLYTQARAIRRRLIAAEALGTVHRHRLHKLRGKVLRALRTYNERELSHFLALWSPAIEGEIAAAGAASDMARAA